MTPISQQSFYAHLALHGPGYLFSSKYEIQNEMVLFLHILMFCGFGGVWVRQPARTSLSAGCEGVAAINTITSVMGINLDTLRPEPCVEG